MARSEAEELLHRLYRRYLDEVPYARTFVELAGGDFQNDHVAFRSLRRPKDGIGPFAAVFESLGWRRAGEVKLPDVHVEAIHLSHPDGLPRVFVSELLGDELSPVAQSILRGLPMAPPPPLGDPAALADWFAPPEPFVDEDDLLALEKESQYAAWICLFGRKVNHFTASVDDVEAWQARLAAAGVPMKDAIEGAPGSALRQTATRAAPLTVSLAGGVRRQWPYAYLEIAQRQPGFDGFVAPQARQLFDMTTR